MKPELRHFFKENEIYLVSVVIGIAFVAAMTMVASMLRASVTDRPYEELSAADLDNVFTTGYLRFREDNGSPYLKVELHNGTQWWIKQIRFKFDGTEYSISDPDAFQPLGFGARRCILVKPPKHRTKIDYDLKVHRAFGYPPAKEPGRPAPGTVAEKTALDQLKGQDPG